MSVVLDFSGTLYDDATPYEVPFSSDGESAVVPFVIRAEYGTGRAAPNPLYVYSDRIRVGLSEAACLEATWGAGLDDVGDVTVGGVACYIQFKREAGDGSEAVPLTDALGLVSSGFTDWPQGAHGTSVSLGTATGSAVVLAGAHGRSVSSGTAAAAQITPGVAHGASVSYGEATPAVDTLPYSQNFSSVTDGDSVLGVDGWYRTNVLQNTASTMNAATVSGQKFVEFKNNWTSGTMRAAMTRDFDVDMTNDVRLTFKFRMPSASTAPAGIGLYSSYDPKDNSGVQFLTLQLGYIAASDYRVRTYNGSSYVDVFTGLSAETTYTVTVTFGKDDTTAVFTLDGGAGVEEVTRMTVPTDLVAMVVSLASASAQTVYVGAFALERA